MLRLLIVRHGQTDWNLERRNQGHADIPLNATGCAQAEALAAALKHEQIGFIISSDMQRTLATAKAPASELKLEIETDPRLRERDYGEWEGKTADELFESAPDLYRKYKRNPVLTPSGGAETGLVVFMRVAAFLCDLLRDRSGSGLLMTHGGTGSAVIGALLEGSPATAACIRLHNCSITEFILEEDRRRMMRFDDQSHLPENLRT